MVFEIKFGFDIRLQVQKILAFYDVGIEDSCKFYSTCIMKCLMKTSRLNAYEECSSCVLLG